MGDMWRNTWRFGYFYGTYQTSSYKMKFVPSVGLIWIIQYLVVLRWLAFFSMMRTWGAGSPRMKAYRKRKPHDLPDIVGIFILFNSKNQRLWFLLTLLHLRRQSIILLFGQQTESPRSLSRPRNSHVNRRKIKNYPPLPLW